MKIIAISILRACDDTQHPVFLCSSTDLSSFGYFERSTVGQFVKFISRQIIERTPKGKRQTVVHEGNNICTYVRSDGLGVAIVADMEYPERVAFIAMGQLLDQFHSAYAMTWPSIKQDNSMKFDPINKAIVEYQDPSKVDKISKIQKDLNQTMDIMHKTIDSVLERQVKLDKLVEDSDDLTRQSKAFYHTAAKHNQCCTIS